MTQTNRSPQTEPRRRRRVRRTRRTTAGVVAQYIHELSERHALREPTSGTHRRFAQVRSVRQPTSQL